MLEQLRYSENRSTDEVYNRNPSLKSALDAVGDARFVFVDFNSIFDFKPDSKELTKLKYDFKHYLHDTNRNRLHKEVWHMNDIKYKFQDLIRALQKRNKKLKIISTTEEDSFILDVMNYFYSDCAVMTFYDFDVVGASTYKLYHEKHFKEFVKTGSRFFGEVFDKGPYSNQTYQHIMCSMMKNNYGDHDFRKLGMVLLSNNDADLKIAADAGVKSIKILPNFVLQLH